MSKHDEQIQAIIDEINDLKNGLNGEPMLVVFGGETPNGWEYDSFFDCILSAQNQLSELLRQITMDHVAGIKN